MPDPDAVRRRRDVALAGHRGDASAARAALSDADPVVRGTGLGALRRAGALTADDLAAALADPAPSVRRRAAEEMAALGGAAGLALVPLLADDDAMVAEAAAFALGELEPPGPGSVAALAAAATDHDDALVREAAVAALGSLGDPAGLPALLTACTDKATVRRRAVLALAAFESPEVEQMLQTLAEDRDRQVRQSAEDLLNNWGTT